MSGGRPVAPPFPHAAFGDSGAAPAESAVETKGTAAHGPAGCPGTVCHSTPGEGVRQGAPGRGSTLKSVTLAVQIILCAVLVLGGAALLVVGRRGLQGRLPRNRYAGVRTPAALRTEEAFELGNRVAAPATLAGGAVGVLSGAALPMLPSLSSVLTIAVIGLVGGFALMTIGGVLGTRAAATVRVNAPGSGAVSANPCGSCAGGCCGALQRE